MSASVSESERVQESAGESRRVSTSPVKYYLSPHNAQHSTWCVNNT